MSSATKSVQPSRAKYLGARLGAKVVYEGAVISLELPESKMTTTEDGSGFIFTQRMIGGDISIHVNEITAPEHGEKDSILVEATLTQEVYGPNNLCHRLDLKPTKESSATHKLEFHRLEYELENDLPIGAKTFKCLAPLNGFIVFNPIN